MEKKVEVRNLRISFKTNNGTVKAVRDISFELNKGETLAIVGESGSGKSVTARAMLGILAPNSIVEGGEIIYDGKDLLKLTEEEFHDYRGNKISMIFQDPLSSLNPIMRIGKQLTEAMLLNGKANQKIARKAFNTKINQLHAAMCEGGVSKSTADAQIAEFKKFTKKSSELEKDYNEAIEAANNIISSIEGILIDIINGEPKVVKDEVIEMVKSAKRAVHDFVVREDASVYISKLSELSAKAKAYDSISKSADIVKLLNEVKEILNKAVAFDKPNFFTIGYYAMYNPNEPLTAISVKELNAKARTYLDENFMLEFIKNAGKGIKFSADKSDEAKKNVIEELKKALPVYQKEKLDEKECMSTAKHLSKLVEDSIDHLALHKNNFAYTFETSLVGAINSYFNGIPNNEKENKRFAKESAEREKKLAKGKDVPKVVPPVIVDLELVKSNMQLTITRLIESYQKHLESKEAYDIDALTVEMIDYLKAQDSAIVYKVTKKMAYNKAIKLMEDVGIADPRKRFKQFPFEFSGGMRQRIVIAIALAANPDVLICDEPTTALDVTIQAQILELINDLKVKRQLSVIFITHDLGVVANMADRIAVMYAGKICEYGTVDDIFYEPAHPYTWALLSSMPDLDTKEKLEAIPGTPPNMIYPPVGDAFAARNKYAMQIDFEQQPPLFEVSETHKAATWLLHPSAPKVEPPKIVTDRIARMRNKEVQSNE